MIPHPSDRSDLDTPDHVKDALAAVWPALLDGVPLHLRALVARRIVEDVARILDNVRRPAHADG